VTFLLEDDDRDLFEEVSLDGGESFDFDGELAQYHWVFEGSVGESLEENPTLQFPIGTTRGALTVIDNDGKESSPLVIEVVVSLAPAAVAEKIMIFPENLGALNQRYGQSVAITEDHILIGTNLVQSSRAFIGRAGFVVDRNTRGVVTTVARTHVPSNFQANIMDASVTLTSEKAVIGDPMSERFNLAGAGALRSIGLGGQGGLVDYFSAEPEVNSFLGASVAASESYVVGGAPGSDGQGSNSGCVIVFDAISGTQLMKLQASDGKAGARFGCSIAMEGSLLVVGAPGGAGLAGKVYVYDLASGAEVSSFLAAIGFGKAVAISDQFILIGAPNSIGGGSNMGEAFVFDRETGGLISRLVPQSYSGGSFFGFSVALAGSYGLVGSPLEPQNNGLSSFSSGTASYYRFRKPLASARESYDRFVLSEFPQLAADERLPTAQPFEDGVSNLLKYAFNMDLRRANQGQLVDGGAAGLPRGEIVEVGEKKYWQFEFVRRIGSALIYLPEFSRQLEDTTFEEFIGEQEVEEIPGTGFERVRVTALEEIKNESEMVFGDLTALYDLAAPAMLPQVEQKGRVLVVINNGGGQIFEKLPRLAQLSLAMISVPPSCSRRKSV